MMPIHKPIFTKSSSHSKPLSCRRGVWGEGKL
jgi:hypothetical protein